MRLAMLPLFVIAFVVACAAATPPAASRPPVRIEICLNRPPPRPPSLAASATPDCPDRFALCVDEADGAELDAYLSKVARWVQAAWESCGPETIPSTAAP